jgi:hypothetical protein
MEKDEHELRLGRNAGGVRRVLFQDILAKFAWIETETMIIIRVDGNPSQIRTYYLLSTHQEFIICRT